MSTAIVAQHGHVHYLGPTNRCWCGFKLVVPRFCVNVEIYDNDTKKYICADESAMYHHPAYIVEALERVIRELRNVR